jgi:hypothetical protein
MASFVLSEEVSSLEYNFEPYAGKGTIPEPSSLQITAFKKGLAQMVEYSARNEDIDVDVEKLPTSEYAARLSKLLREDTSEYDDKVLHMIADVCSDTPSYDDLTALPFRARQAFLGWVIGALIVPEAPRPATSP